MTNISSTNALGMQHNFQTKQTDQKTRIQFENTLAAVKAGQKTDHQAEDSVQMTNQDNKTFSELLAQGPAKQPVPAQKVMASLTHLIQQNQTGSELDVTL